MVPVDGSNSASSLTPALGFAEKSCCLVSALKLDLIGADNVGCTGCLKMSLVMERCQIVHCLDQSLEHLDMSVAEIHQSESHVFFLSN